MDKDNEPLLKTKLTDLNTHLFLQLERLNDDELKGAELDEEIKRARSITNVSNQIINGGNLLLNAQKALRDELYGKDNKLPRMLTE